MFLSTIFIGSFAFELLVALSKDAANQMNPCYEEAVR